MPVPVVALVGPTASGKSDLAIALASDSAASRPVPGAAGPLPARGEIGGAGGHDSAASRPVSGAAGPLPARGEIVNADSMQLYRGMDIGTAKVPVSQRGGVPHHLLDVLDVSEAASVAQVQRWARAAIDDIRGRGLLPIAVGGSALYMHAILDRMEFPGTDPQVRRRLEHEAARFGDEAMHARLAVHDPAAAQAIGAGNRRRVVRALEVIELTGQPFTARLPEHEYALDPVCQIGLRVPRDVLTQRIRTRVAQMWAAGFVDEVRALERAGLRDGPTASRALGYAQVLAYLDGGCTEAEAQEATVRATNRFARRQMTWYRRDHRIVWLDHDDPDLLDRARAAIATSSIATE